MHVMHCIRAFSALFGAFILAGAAGCQSQGNQQNAAPKETAAASSAPLAASNAAPQPSVSSIMFEPQSQATPTAAPTASGPQIAGAVHILIAYKGAQFAPKEVTRSKDEAKKIAQDLLTKIKDKKATIGELASKQSDDPSKVAAGAIGNFERLAMPEAFSNAVFSMDVGAISDVVETPRGFHIIQRTR